MHDNAEKIRLIRERLTRIGIGERSMSDEMILASYSISSTRQLCRAEKHQPPVPDGRTGE
ncbi:hypothetical protein [Methanoregula sp.]|uniref:hypothetical protein n=1 Tax=Methanoregula sp. TaxID=2052170 RepID=UPI002C798D62|nr:hypothetical protein [Methanoregula sp.]HVP96185.1 hypothetical protein [Methanoregula sp.]